jgi:predicted membrane metal-binding protein
MMRHPPRPGRRVWPVDEDLGWIGRVHRRTDAALGYGLHSQEAAVVRGMVLGDRSLIPEELEEAFQRSGITHAEHALGSFAAQGAGDPASLLL